MTRGRVPRFAQIRVTVPRCPTLASSWNQISIFSGATPSGVTAATFSWNFF